MAELIWLAGSGGFLVLSVALWRAGTNAGFSASFVGYELRFPQGVKPAEVTPSSLGCPDLFRRAGSNGAKPEDSSSK